MAIDIGVTSPHIAAARLHQNIDPLDHYRSIKSRLYTSACQSVGWDFKPLTLSTFGRAHCETRAIVHRLAVAASKAFGGSDTARTENAWWRNATTLLMERNARMVARCLPIVTLPPIISGVDEGRWGVDPHPRVRRGADVSAESLVAGAVPG
jgi:hypothetical protein